MFAGKPATLYDESNPDWSPTLNVGHSSYAVHHGQSWCVQRHARATELQTKKLGTLLPCSSFTASLPDLGLLDSQSFTEPPEFVVETGCAVVNHFSV